VHDALGVSRVERIGDLDTQRDHGFNVQWPTRNAMLQRQSVQKLHDDEGLPVLVINLVNSADVGMIQSGGGFGFALKTAERLRVFGYLVGQELEGNERAEL
jgi:hypothetical protein